MRIAMKHLLLCLKQASEHIKVGKWFYKRKCSAMSAMMFEIQMMCQTTSASAFTQPTVSL